MGGIITTNGSFVPGGSPISGNAPGVIGQVLGTALTFFSSGGAKTIRDNAKRKKAQDIANSGGYSTLTAYQKMLIGNRDPGMYGKIDPVTLPGQSYSALIILVLGIIVVIAAISSQFRR